MLAGIGAVLAVAVVALAIVLGRGKGSDHLFVAAGSSNVSAEKESGGTEKSGGLFDIGSDKKWEKEYAERLDAYLEYYEEHEKDADKVYGWVLLNENKLPYMVLDYIQSTENSNGDEDKTYNIMVLDYIDDTVEVLAERQFEYFASPTVLSNACFIDGGSSYFELKDGRLIELTEKDFGSESEVYLSPYVRIVWERENNRIEEVYEDSLYYDMSAFPYTYIGRVWEMSMPRLCSMGEISNKFLEDILLGKREAAAFDLYKIDDEVFFNDGNRYYIGSDECYPGDFYKELLSYYDAEEKSDVIIKSEGVIYHEGFFEGASFKTLLRELRKRPVRGTEAVCE